MSTSTTPHTLSCTNQHLSRVTTREEGSTLCSVSAVSYVENCLVMSDVRARLTSRVVPPYTGHTVAVQLFLQQVGVPPRA